MFWQPRTDFRDFCSKEATLFCIWAISKYVTVDEAEVMPKVCVMGSSSLCRFTYSLFT